MTNKIKLNNGGKSILWKQEPVAKLSSKTLVHELNKADNFFLSVANTRSEQYQEELGSTDWVTQAVRGQRQKSEVGYACYLRALLLFEPLSSFASVTLCRFSYLTMSMIIPSHYLSDFQFLNTGVYHSYRKNHMVISVDINKKFSIIYDLKNLENYEYKEISHNWLKSICRSPAYRQTWNSVEKYTKDTF